ncbi:MAG: hypothetical protein LBP36_01735 [Oscillospiraceae bacterium]|nr:hypothetical protein [Oscillospiraceae bacterium]
MLRNLRRNPVTRKRLNEQPKMSAIPDLSYEISEQELGTETGAEVSTITCVTAVITIISMVTKTISSPNCKGPND